MEFSPPPSHTRMDVLHALCELSCAWDNATTSDSFLHQRGELLQQLAAISLPWSCAERALLQQVMELGEQTMDCLLQQKAEVAQRLQALQVRRKSGLAYAASSQTVRRVL